MSKTPPKTAPPASSKKAASPARATKATAKPAPKAAAKVAPKPKPKSQPKATAKVAAKPAPKTSTKPAAKPIAKPASKPAPKAAARPGSKSAAKPAPKTIAKPVVKSAAKPAPKAVSRPPAKPVPAKAPPPKAASTVPAQASAQASNKVPPSPVTKPAPPVAPVRSTAKSRAAARPTPAELAEPTQRTIPLPPPNRPPPSNVIDLPRPVRKIDPKLANVWKSKAGRDLSDDELLSMPDSEYMNDKQLEFFRAKLMKQRDDLLDNAGETTEHLREDTSIVPDPADRATIEEEHALELRTRDRERKLLKKISQSIARIEAGDYGFCDETGEPIGLGRLLARPTATLSLEAQQRREMKQKMFGD